ncbi:unnamed protein product [Strongylus vulgaris]|uniref:Uncharacterized protein n=1 Tax=Strongylus vulgaris TaxID=40348 RepID=A0A3P7JJW0_STRVU|nr:unnamed protein product [Strongylus vulgaris]
MILEDKSENIFSDRTEITVKLIKLSRNIKINEDGEAKCTCLNTEQCVPNRNPLEVNASVCMCFEDVTKGIIWPCYPTSVWAVKKCSRCSAISNTCSDPDHHNGTVQQGSTQPCLCQSISHHCMVHPKDEIKWWNHNYTIFPVTDPPTTVVTETEQAFGLSIRKSSYNKWILDIKMLLSWVFQDPPQNPAICRDLKLHVDLEYGNCYTFNFNGSVELKNNRAGPMYGLRLLLDVHEDDSMPTTEAAGVRIVVHEQDQEPFPDTFGYSAPTGFVSSFGLKLAKHFALCRATVSLGFLREFLQSRQPQEYSPLNQAIPGAKPGQNSWLPKAISAPTPKVLHRMDAPYGQCSDTFRPERYIYDEHYSRGMADLLRPLMFGCHRNCFQLKVLDECGCGDPRFPLPSDEKRCCSAKSVTDSNAFPILLVCLAVMITSNWSVTAASHALRMYLRRRIQQLHGRRVDCPAVPDIFNDTEACTEYLRVNTAYIEIYCEQLNFETLRETADYTFISETISRHIRCIIKTRKLPIDMLTFDDPVKFKVRPIKYL